jgi:GNAT superfamily N-acetyltransferase
MKTATVAERPDLAGPAWERTRDTLPEYNNHGDVLNVYWGRLTEEHPQFQFHLVGDADEILARARSIPLRWDGTVDGLPVGIDGAIARGFDEDGANTLCALVIMVPRDLQSRGLSADAVEAMREVARSHGFSSLIAPVRPSWKERYPLAPIERYAGWRRTDGLLFDPWMRVHERLGGTVLKPEPRSLRSGRSGRRWRSRRAASTGSPAGSPPWRSTGRRTAAATGSRTSGCTTRFDPRPVGRELFGRP